MNKKEILEIVDKCHDYAWYECKMADYNTPDEYIAKTLMKMFDYIGRALREEQ